MDRATKPADAGTSAAASANGATPPAETLESLPSVLRSVLAALYEHDAAPPENRVCSNCSVITESQLPGTFVRTHRSYLVNVEHVASIERCRITLTDGTKLPIPKQRFDQVRCELELRVADS